MNTSIWLFKVTLIMVTQLLYVCDLRILSWIKNTPDKEIYTHPSFAILTQSQVICDRTGFCRHWLESHRQGKGEKNQERFSTIHWKDDFFDLIWSTRAKTGKLCSSLLWYILFKGTSSRSKQISKLAYRAPGISIPIVFFVSFPTIDSFTNHLFCYLTLFSRSWRSTHPVWARKYL